MLKRFLAVLLASAFILSPLAAVRAADCKMDLAAGEAYISSKMDNEKVSVVLTLSPEETAAVLGMTSAPANIASAASTMAVIQIGDGSEVLGLVPLTKDGCIIPFSDEAPVAAMISSANLIKQYLVAAKIGPANSI